MIYDYFRVTGAHDGVLDYADSFSITLRNDNVQEFDTRWDEIPSSMTKIPSNDILEKSVCASEISMPNYQKNENNVEKAKIRNFDCEDIHTFHRLGPQEQFNDSQKLTYEKRIRNDDSSRRKSLKKYDDQFAPSTSFKTLRSVLRYNGNYEFDPVQMHCIDQGDMKTSS